MGAVKSQELLGDGFLDSDWPEAPAADPAADRDEGGEDEEASLRKTTKLPDPLAQRHRKRRTRIDAHTLQDLVFLLRQRSRQAGGPHRT